MKKAAVVKGHAKKAMHNDQPTNKSDLPLKKGYSPARNCVKGTSKSLKGITKPI